MAIVHNRIVKSYLILCEGKDVENFMRYYLNSKELSNDPRFGNDIQTFDFEGVDNLPVYLGNIVKMERFESVKRILVLRDAETDVKKAISMVQKAFRVTGLPIPENVNSWKKAADTSGYDIATAFTLLPTCDKNPIEGTLEDLCWNILKHNSAVEMKEDIQGFIDDIKKKYGTISTHEHKSRIHTYFSVNEDYISLKIGEAAKVGAFDWNSEKLNGLNKIITNGFEE